MGYTGMALPILPGPNGRTRIISGDERVVQLFMTSFSDGSNPNPYNDQIGFKAPIFKRAEDFEAKTKILTKIGSIFRRLESEGLAKIAKQPQFFFVESTGQWHVKIVAMSLETLGADGKPKLFDFSFPVGSTLS